MKRLVPLILVIGAGSTAVYAAPRHPAASSRLTALASSQAHAMARQLHGHMRLAGAIRSVRSFSSRPQARHFAPLAVTRAPAKTSAADLTLPNSVVSAGNGQQGAVTSGQGPFSAFHTTWAGFQSGVAAQWDFRPMMILSYTGSVFSDAASAQAFMTDSFTKTKGWSTVDPVGCSDVTGGPCEIVGFVTGNGDISVYDVAQINYCVIEVGYQGDPTLIGQNSDTVTKASAGVFLTAEQQATQACTGSSPGTAVQPQATATATATPTPPAATPVPPTATPIPHTDFHIVSVQLVKSGSASGLAPITRVKVGKKVALYTLVQVTSGRGGLSAAYAFTVTSGGKTAVSRTMTVPLHSPSAVGSYVESLPVTFKKRGSYVFTERVTIDGMIQSQATSFTVVK